MQEHLASSGQQQSHVLLLNQKLFIQTTYGNRPQQSTSSNQLPPLSNFTTNGCKFDQEVQLYINLTTFWYLLLALITAAGLLISLVSNMIIIYLVSSTKSLRRNPSNIIAANLSFSDLLYCIQWPSVIYSSVTQSTGVLEETFVCQTLGFITVSTALASILTVLAMSVERAFVIKFPIQAKNRFTIRIAWVVTFLIWLISLTACLPPLFGKFNRYTLDPSKTICTLEYLSPQANYKLYILFLYVTFWIVPFVIITISYVLIMRTFKKSSHLLERVSGLNNCDLRLEHSSPDLRWAGSSNFTHSNGSKYSLKRSINLWPLKHSSEACKMQIFSLKLDSCSILKSRRQKQVMQAAIPFESRAWPTSLRRVASSSLLNESDRRPNRSCSITEPANQRPDKICNPIPLHELLSRTKISHNLWGRRRHLLDGARNHSQSSPSSSVYGGQQMTENSTKHQLSDIVGSFASHNVNVLPNQAANSHLFRTMLQIRLAKMSFYLILLWVVSWTPMASLAMINSVLSCHQASAAAVFLASLMTKLGPTFDVFIYGISHPKIKIKFRNIIKRLLMVKTKR